MNLFHMLRVIGLAWEGPIPRKVILRGLSIGRAIRVWARLTNTPREFWRYLHVVITLEMLGQVIFAKKPPWTLVFTTEVARIPADVDSVAQSMPIQVACSREGRIATNFFASIWTVSRDISMVM